MRNLDETTITQAVISRHANASNERLKTIMTSLVQHLHGFAREIHLTEVEWAAGIEFLTAVGRTCSPTRQEFILLSDTLGLSMLVSAQNHRKPESCTEATVFGPFHVEGAPERSLGADVANGAQGAPCFVRGRVRSLTGEPISGAVIDVWQADANGMYDVQYEELTEYRARATLRSAQDGGYHFRSIVTTPYQIPHDGPVGKMLELLNRHAWRPAHLHFRISAPGFETLVTHVFRDLDPYLDSDAVFGVRSSLVADWRRHTAGLTPDGEVLDTPFHTLDFDFVMNPTHKEK